MKKRTWKHKICLFLLFIPGLTVLAQNKPDAVRAYRNANYQQAISICLNEISINRNNIESYVVLCWSLIRLNRYEEADTYAQIGRSLNRYDPRIVEILGEINYFQGSNHEALSYFQEYINLAPEGQRIEMVYYFMGEIFIRLGRFRHADIALSTAVHRVPENAAWWTRLAYARENAGDLPEAAAAYERALSLNAQLSDARSGLDRIRQTLRSR
ncbi:MAG: tetratricopeptide repeat protein [Spirochaetaceae bacterium]|jgi:predicted Zn-dependent protease|nr:tetratricopeptide repeat protein [Spirochaetaceae bacterium]